MNNWKERQVVLITTDKESDIALINGKPFFQKSVYLKDSFHNTSSCKPQHFYVLSDKDIKELTELFRNIKFEDYE